MIIPALPYLRWSWSEIHSAADLPRELNLSPAEIGALRRGKIDPSSLNPFQLEILRKAALTPRSTPFEILINYVSELRGALIEITEEAHKQGESWGMVYSRGNPGAVMKAIGNRDIAKVSLMGDGFVFVLPRESPPSLSALLMPEASAFVAPRLSNRGFSAN
jgi:hypothetical protein